MIAIQKDSDGVGYCRGCGTTIGEKHHQDCELVRLRIGYERYEIARKMNPREWAEAWELNIKTGKPFDEIIDDKRQIIDT